MKQGGATERKKLGFTIVETMIVLAVSGGLFVIAALYINGRQAKTEFQVGVRDAQTKIQQVINEVNSGYYPSESFSCTPNSSSGGILAIGSGSDSQEQGKHDGCILIGKTIVVHDGKLYVFSLAGNRTTTDGTGKRDVQSPKEAHATAIAKAGASSSANNNAPDITEIYILQNGLTFNGYKEGSDTKQTTTSPYAFSVMGSFAQTTNATTGSQVVDIYGFSATSKDNFSNAKDNIQGISAAINGEQAQTSPFPPLKEVRICLQSGGTDQSAWIVIGGQGIGGAAVRTEIKGNKTCA